MLIEFQDIHKYYGKSKANCGISFTIEPGTIHGILGENGAGKSTLMKIMSGYLRKTSGSLLINGNEVDFESPNQAIERGVGMLYQDPLDFSSLTVLENFMIGQARGLTLHRDSFRKKLHSLCAQFGFMLDDDSLTGTLTVGERQQLEMLRLLSLGIDALILDEPTTGISDIQKEILFNSLKALAERGKSVILVSHKLEDVEALCSQVTVLRQGRVSGNMDRPFDTTELLRMIFGTPPSPPAQIESMIGEPVLEFNDIAAAGGRSGLRECSAVIRRGEIVGLAGLEGSGQDIFLRVASGIRKPLKGNIFLNGEKMTGKDYSAFNSNKVVFMPAARLEEGLMPNLTIADHFALRDSEKGFLLNWSQWTKKSAERIERYHIKGRPDSAAETLSGGNQQRLLLSLLPPDTSLLLLENPTRGLDVESTTWIWNRLREDLGQTLTTIVFSSTELDELLMIAQRILVFFNGRLIKDVRKENTSSNELGMAIAGKI